jgi:hypothetical protein
VGDHVGELGQENHARNGESAVKKRMEDFLILMTGSSGMDER